MSNEVRNAADAAVSASLTVLEQAACRVRRGKGGHTVLDADGFVAAAFRHRTSRAGDRHLHTHVVVAILGTTGDGVEVVLLLARGQFPEAQHGPTARAARRRTIRQHPAGASASQFLVRTAVTDVSGSTRVSR